VTRELWPRLFDTSEQAYLASLDDAAQAVAATLFFSAKEACFKAWGGTLVFEDIHITPDGRFLYASERTTSTLTAYKVDASSGKLTTIGSVPTEKQPRGFHIDPAGRYLAAVGELSDSMTVYAIDQSSGALGKLKSYPTGKKPNWVEFLSLP